MITTSDLYAMGMESNTAYRLMPELCKLLGMPFPPATSEQPKEKEHDKEFAN